METLYLLLPLSLLFVAVIGGAFWWAVTTGQFDQTEDPSQTILRDDDSTQTTQPPRRENP